MLQSEGFALYRHRQPCLGQGSSLDAKAIVEGVEEQGVVIWDPKVTSIDTVSPSVVMFWKLVLGMMVLRGGRSFQR